MGKGWDAYCVECGCCSGELGKGWVAFFGEDPDGIDPPRLSSTAPSAAAEFGYRPDIAANYVCAWEPLPAERTDGDGAGDKSRGQDQPDSQDLGADPYISADFSPGR